MNRLVIIGAGGHGRVVADAARLSGQWVEIVFLDDRYPELLSSGGFTVVGAVSDVSSNNRPEDAYIVAVGNAAARQTIVKRTGLAAEQFARVIHPSAIVADSAQLGHGVMVLAGVVINCDSQIEEHVIVNTASVVEHDCRVGAFTHLSPRSCLGGEVIIGEGCWIGIGALVLPLLQLGASSILGAGAVMTRSFDNGLTLVGVPAQIKGE